MATGEATWESVAPSPGFQGAFAGEYAKKHNPASYYTPIAAAYKTNAVPLV